MAEAPLKVWLLPQRVSALCFLLLILPYRVLRTQATPKGHLSGTPLARLIQRQGYLPAAMTF